MKKEPKIIEVFSDNGEHSHWALVNSETGEKLWSENPAECKAMGYPVESSHHDVIEEIEDSYGAIQNKVQKWHSELHNISYLISKDKMQEANSLIRKLDNEMHLNVQ